MGHGEAGGETLVVDFLADGLGVGDGVDCMIPERLIPGAASLVDAGHRGEGLGHDAGDGVLVGPDAAVSESPAICDVLGAVEDLPCDSKHAAGEAGKVFHVGGKSRVAAGSQGDASRNEDVLLADVHGTEEEILLCYFDKTLIHATVLLGVATEHQVLLVALAKKPKK